MYFYLFLNAAFSLRRSHSPSPFSNWNWRHRSKLGKPEFGWIKALVTLEMKGWIISFLVVLCVCVKKPFIYSVLAITQSILKNYTFNFPLEILATMKRRIYPLKVIWLPWCLCRIMLLVSHWDPTMKLATVWEGSKKKQQFLFSWLLTESKEESVQLF